MISELRKCLTRELDDLVEEPTVRDVQARVRFLHAVLSAVDSVQPGMLPARGAGFGSRVALLDLDGGARLDYTLMAGDAIDLDAGQVSLLSPVGQALLGRVEGEEVSVRTPAGRRRLRVLAVERLEEGLPREREAPAVRVA